MDGEKEFRARLAAHACGALLALLQASCTLVGYDARLVPSEAGTAGLEPLEPVVVPVEDASHLQVGAPDAGVSSDAGAPTPFDSAVPSEPVRGPDAGQPVAGPDAGQPVAGPDAGQPVAAPDAGQPVAAPDAGEVVAASIPFADQDGGATFVVRDAGSPSDAGASSGDAGALTPCGGARALGLCWYLGSPWGSCNSACTSHGGVDVRAASLVGTTSQGGSLDSCAQILPALGVAKAPLRAFRTDSYGLGCHAWSTGDTYWLDDPSPLYSPSVVTPLNARMACGCAR